MFYALCLGVAAFIVWAVLCLACLTFLWKASNNLKEFRE